MVPKGHGSILFTGATASLRGGANFVNLAVGKFGLRAVAQSMARELGPKGVHVAHVIIDGQIAGETRKLITHSGRNGFLYTMERNNGQTVMVKPYLDNINWTKGPAKAELKSLAEVQVPEGFVFTGAKGTQKLLEKMGNPTSGSELGFLAPTSLVWFVVFEFADVGYVKDDDKDKK